MNKFKFLTLSLVCATIAFGYNSANATNTVILNKINPSTSDTDIRSSKEIANQVIYQILQCGIKKYPGQKQNVLDYADTIKRMIKEGGCYDDENKKFVWKGQYNYSIPLSYEEQRELLDQAECIFYQILSLANDNLQYHNGADHNTYKTLVQNIVDDLTKISRDNTSELLM